MAKEDRVGRPTPSWVGRELEAAYRAGRLATQFDRPAPARTRPRGDGAARGPAEADAWHH
ncbi:MAG: hypothetical protein ACOY94_08910 [Bacillota bacterium]